MRSKNVNLADLQTCCSKFCQKTIIINVIIILTLSFKFECGSYGNELQKINNTPIFLTNELLDTVTAGAAGLTLNLSSAAQGPNALATDIGAVHTAQATVVEVTTGSGRVIFLKSELATLFLATGQASATGSDGAICAANVLTFGDFAYLTKVSQTSVTQNAAGLPTAVTCSCSALGIALDRP